MPELIPPRKIHRFVEELRDKLCPGSDFLRVPVIPEPAAQLGGCFPNVRDKILKSGGTIQHGWCIWENPGLFVEGEFHGVWVSPDQKLIDVTPTIEGGKEILFLPDNKRVFNGTDTRDNVRLAINPHPLVQAFLQHCEQLYEFKEVGTNPENPRLMTLDADRYEWFRLRKAELGRAMMQITPGRNEMCRCGSGDKYKKCCGK